MKRTVALTAFVGCLAGLGISFGALSRPPSKTTSSVTQSPNRQAAGPPIQVAPQASNPPFTIHVATTGHPGSGNFVLGAVAPFVPIATNGGRWEWKTCLMVQNGQGFSPPQVTIQVTRESIFDPVSKSYVIHWGGSIWMENFDGAGSGCLSGFTLSGADFGCSGTGSWYGSGGCGGNVSIQVSP